jgi:SAM-dependent methyltransferase
MAHGFRDQCPVCNSSNIEPLVPPHPTQSITSGGFIVKAPLRKTQCLDCGLASQQPHPESFKGELYQNRYALYHQRPGTSASEKSRYASMADWIFAELGAHSSRSLLDVGCAGGLLLEALRNARPELEYAGIEPSLENGELARERGFSVTTGFIPETKPPKPQYDIVLTSNVVSHITDPVSFLRAMALMTASEGRVVVYSHDGVEPSADLLWTDIEFSFCREHLGALAAKAGLELLHSKGFKTPLGQEDKHVLVFQRSGNPAPVPRLSDEHRQALLNGRRAYFAAWRQLARLLASKAESYSGPVMNFGASFWSMSLSAYCPDYWQRVKACVVDSGGSTFLDKPVILTKELPGLPRPLIVLGTNPAAQESLKKRLASQAEVISWHDLIKR